MEEHTNQIAIWFFIGVLLFLYGLLILGAGIYHLFVPPPQQMALSELHPDIWWGGLLLVIGGIYCMKYWPFQKSRATP
jgi:hypothetical protein